MRSLSLNFAMFFKHNFLSIIGCLYNSLLIVIFNLVLLNYINESLELYGFEVILQFAF